MHIIYIHACLDESDSFACKAITRLPRKGTRQSTSPWKKFYSKDIFVISTRRIHTEAVETPYLSE